MNFFSNNTTTTTNNNINLSSPSKTSKILILSLLIQQSNEQIPNSPTWAEIENKIEDSLLDWYQYEPPKHIRLLNHSIGLYDLCINIVRAPNGKHAASVLDASWLLLAHGMSCPEKNDKDNIETLTKGVEAGLIELSVKEINQNRCNGRLLARATICLTNTAAYDEFASEVVTSGGILACLNLIKRTNMYNISSVTSLLKAMGVLCALAMLRPQCLRAIPSLVDTLLPLLPLLNDIGNDSMVMIGFRACRCIIRISRSEDSVEIIRQHPIIFEFYPKLIRKILDSKDKSYYSAYWKISGIAYDLARMSTFLLTESECHLLIPFIALVIEMLTQHNQQGQDRDLLFYGLVFLSQISWNELCRAKLREFQQEIKLIQQLICNEQLYGVEFYVMMEGVVNIII
jgi:hypothetical protein